jgi:xylose isomerase
MTYFPGLEKIKYVGKQLKSDLAFNYYNPDEMIAGKTMRDYLRFSVAYWHTFTYDGSDPFGAATMVRSWSKYTGMDLAKSRVEAAFEFFEKLGNPFFCFHDRDIAPEGDTLRETNANLDVIVSMIQDYMKTSPVKLLWNTANMFTNPRFVHGAASSCNADVFAFAAAQVKKALETAQLLQADNYVFWGGREGYETLLNTDLSLEQDNMARFFHMVVDYAKEIGFEGQLLLEPKPKEPMTHQYDFDAATTIAFLRTYGLEKYFKLNLEANHGTLAGHTFAHELRVARSQGVLGSLDANQGDPLLGWDTDEFPTDLYTTTLAMYEVVKNDGLGKGGLNFDAKVRRASFLPDDLFYAHIAGMDSFALGLKVAKRLIEDKVFDDFIDYRYRSYREGIGQDILSGKADLKSLEAYILDKKDIHNESGRLEQLKNTLNHYIFQEA